MRLRTGGLVLAAMVSAPAVCAAQGQQAPVVEASRQTQFGASLQGFYDSNITRSSASLAESRGLAREEFVVSPAVTIDVVQPLGRQAVFLRGSGGYDFHSRNEQLEAGRADFTGGYLTELGICRPMVFGTYRAQQTDLADADDQIVENVAQATSVAVTTVCGRSIGPGISVTASRQDVKNSADIQEVSDATTEALSAILAYNHPVWGKLGLAYAYTDNEFPNRIIPGRPVGDGFLTTAYGLSLERDIGARLTLAASVGQTHVKREFAPEGTRLKFTATTYSGDLIYRAGARLRLEFTGKREVRPSERLGKLYDIETSGQATAVYRMGRRIQIRAGHSVADVDSNADTALLRRVVTKARTNATFASVQFRQSDRLGIILDVRREDHETDVPDFNYDLVRVGLTATTRF